MSEFLDRISKLSPQRLALLADELNERVQAAERNRRIPLAIVGMGCRLPGKVENPEQFWDLLSHGTDAVTEIPISRWDTRELYDPNPATPGKMATRWGGFIDGAEQFDPKFFGIAPAEAVSMDPQQRLLLETSWEALEDAGVAPSRLAGSQTGVFVGICNGDYSQVALSSPRDKISAYFAPGLSHAVAAGRISYVLGLQGPSMAVDTSCSASLVAVHLACQSLRLGECSAALAGGVNLILNPDITIALSQSRMMAPDGRCKAFSESADGFVRGEGCAMIFLKRLPDAIRDHNRILAVIRGTACNQDGRSSGLTAPNGPSQEAVVSAALADAGLNPADVDYIEAHGTGTSLGDPIEAGALNAVFANRSKDAGPLRVGSVKTNLGHLESAAGIAGLMKLVLSIQHGKIPPNLHFQNPSRRIEWDRLPMHVPTNLEPWTRRGRSRVGGVSSFGFSGTNAHVIVEEYRSDLESTSDRTSTSSAQADSAAQPYLFPISAKSVRALHAIAARLHRHLAGHPSIQLAEIQHTLQAGRSHFEYRAALVAASRTELLDLLHAFNQDAVAEEIQTGRAVGHAPRIAFIFGEESVAFQNIGELLYECSPVFRGSVQRCEQILQSELGLELPSSLFGSVANSTANQADSLPSRHARVAAFAAQYALAELWRSFGIQPVVAFGYGLGEWVAACVAGVLNLRDGLRLAIATASDGEKEFAKLADSIEYLSPKIPLITHLAVHPELPTAVAFERYGSQGSHLTLPNSESLTALAKESCAAHLLMGDSAALTAFTQLSEKFLTGKSLASFDSGEIGERKMFQTAAALYVLGCELDTSGVSSTPAATTVSLPTYPFERERYWLDSSATSQMTRPTHQESSRHTGAALPSVDASVPTSDRASASDEWVYDLVWEPKPLPSKHSDLSTVKVDEKLIESLNVEPVSEELIRIGHGSVVLQPICATVALETLQTAGLSPLPTDAFTLEELGHRLNVIPARSRVLARLVSILLEDKIVERSGSAFRFVDFRPRPEADAELIKLAAAYPESATEIKILRRCAKKMAAVLQGKYDPMQLVFSDGSIEEAEQIYEHSPVCRFFNQATARLISAAVDSIPDRQARILEIGGGTGATTVSVLRELAGKHVDYCFTDVSAAFLTQARIKFSRTPFITYRLLDIEHPPVEQGFTAGSFDIIVAANVLHATSDLRRTLAHVRKLLAPGGILLLVEGVRPDRWLDLTFGLTDGWWRVNDLELRPEHPLVSVPTWSRILEEAGIHCAQNIAYINSDGSQSQQTVIVAQASSAEKSAETSGRNWVILADDSGVGDALHNLLVARHEVCQTIRRPGSADPVGDQWSRLAKACLQSHTEIVYLWGADIAEAKNTDATALAEDLCANTLVRVIQTMMQPANRNARLWIATRGAQATPSFAPTLSGALQSLAWGVGRCLGIETPGQYRGLIDLDPALAPDAAATQLLAELLADDVEDQTAYRNGERLVARLQHAKLNDRSSPTGTAIRGDSSYLITGGLGGLGLRVATWVAEQRPGHLVLLNRTGTENTTGPFADQRQNAVRELQARGVNVTVVEGDVASRSDMDRLFLRFGKEFPQLRGVFHAATVVSTATLENLTGETMDAMFRPKVSGTLLLHEHTKTLPLDFFLAFSSTTSLLGAKGLAHYAAANQFLDAFAHYRRSLGLPMLSVNWGAWDILRSVSTAEQQRLAEAGLLPMPSQDVLDLFPDLMTSPRAQVTIAHIDWRVLKPILEAQRFRPMLAGFGQGSIQLQQDKLLSISLAAMLDELIHKQPEDRRQSIEAFVQEQAAQVLGFRRGELPPNDIPLTDLGLDSLMAVDLKNRLQAGLGQNLSPTVVFDYPRVSDMVELLDTMLWTAHGDSESEVLTSQKDEIRI
jgi:acyl transferase domain-containing protein/protein-L-isoaspartate O-methyltransferase